MKYTIKTNNNYQLLYKKDMYRIRFLKNDDFDKLYSLYKNVSKQQGGIARSESEIDENYIRKMIEESMINGISFVIDSLDKKSIIAEIHCHKLGPNQYSHVLSNLTIVVDKEHQGKGIGKLIFKYLLNFLEQKRADILRLELFTRESNLKAIQFYEKIGFKIEGKFINRVIINGENSFESDIEMAWFNKNHHQQCL